MFALCFLPAIFAGNELVQEVHSFDDVNISQDSQAQSPDRPTMVCNAVKANSLGASLYAIVPEHVAKAAVPLSCIAINRGRGVLFVDETGYFIECELNLKSDQGDPVPFTRHGRSLFASEMGAQRATIQLQPGEVRHWEFNLSDAFETLKPGNYSISLTTKIDYASPNVKVSEAVADSIVIRELQFEVIK